MQFYHEGKPSTRFSGRLTADTRICIEIAYWLRSHLLRKMRRHKELAMNLSYIRARGDVWRVSAIFVVAVALNYVWELAQSPLYRGMGDFSRMLWHCFVASLGDGALILLIFAAGRAVFRR